MRILLLIGMLLSLSLQAPLAAQANAEAMQKITVVRMTTSKGTIWVRLYDDTPIHRDNFVKLAKEKFFKKTTFHRVIKDFMIQGGDPYTRMPEKADSIGNGGPGYTLEAEFLAHRIHKRGVLSAARQPDQVNPERRSSGSQFYIVQGNTFTDDQLNAMVQRVRSIPGFEDFSFSEEARTTYKEVGGAPWLDLQYTVFGEVIKGMQVVDWIGGVEVDEKKGHRPLNDVTIRKVKVYTWSEEKFRKKFPDASLD